MPEDDSGYFYFRGVARQTGSEGSVPANFDEPDLIRQRAKNHLETLKREIERFNQLHPYTILPEDDPDARHYVIKIVHPDLMNALPAVLVFGDFVSSLRSSLDHLAWQLARLGGKRPRRDVCFPICGENTIDTQVQIARTTFGIPDQAISLMKSFQPYQSGDAYKSTFLWRLNALWSIDKHRHIMAFAALPLWQFRVHRVKCGEVKVPFPGEQTDNCTVMRLPFALKDCVEFNPERRVELRFIDLFEEIEVTYQDLVEIYDFVTNIVFPPFARFFA